MDRIVTRRILGESIIPRYNVRPPLTVTDSFDFFVQLENFGFTIENVEEPVKVEEKNKEEKDKKEKENKKEEITSVLEDPIKDVVEVTEESTEESVDETVEETVVENKEEIVKNKFNKKNKK